MISEKSFAQNRWYICRISQLQQVLNQAQMCRNGEDQVWWHFENSGTFSVKSFLDNVHDPHEHDADFRFANQVWHGLVPAKAELLLWFVILGRLNTKERLHRLNVIRSDDITCPMCNHEVESLSHVSFTCHFAWDIWNVCCYQWGLNWIIARCPRMNFQAWIGAPLRGVRKKLWVSCFFTIVWSIWDARSKKVFQNKSITGESFLLELSHRWKYCISRWNGNSSIRFWFQVL